MKTIEQLTHTPGPWTSEFPVRNVVICKEFAICEVYTGDDDPESAANARLIAAAPELLASLKEFVALYDGTRDLLGRTVATKLARAEAAIAKAEGR